MWLLCLGTTLGCTLAVYTFSELMIKVQRGRGRPPRRPGPPALLAGTLGLPHPPPRPPPEDTFLPVLVLILVLSNAIMTSFCFLVFWFLFSLFFRHLCSILPSPPPAPLPVRFEHRAWGGGGVPAICTCSVPPRPLPAAPSPPRSGPAVDLTLSLGPLRGPLPRPAPPQQSPVSAKREAVLLLLPLVVCLLNLGGPYLFRILAALERHDSPVLEVYVAICRCEASWARCRLSGAGLLSPRHPALSPCTHPFPQEPHPQDGHLGDSLLPLAGPQGGHPEGPGEGGPGGAGGGLGLPGPLPAASPRLSFPGSVCKHPGGPRAKSHKQYLIF